MRSRPRARSARATACRPFLRRAVAAAHGRVRAQRIGSAARRRPRRSPAAQGSARRINAAFRRRLVTGAPGSAPSGWARLAAVLVLAACVALPGGAAARLSTERVASGLEEPLFVTAPEGDGRLFILEKDGVIQLLEDGRVLEPPFLDLRGRVDSGPGEAGLLGLAFPPDFETGRAFYVYYTGSTDGALESRVSRFAVTDTDPGRGDPGSEVILLRLAQPFGNHNGGTLAFGPDGMLYLGLGDGGSAGDPGDRAQDGGTLLGKLLRIDVRFEELRDDEIAIPPDNPFAGDPDVRDEIWALGLRNPYRFSFDRDTGDLYIADVGQDTREEIDVEPRPDPGGGSPGGRNYGWDVMEGLTCFDPGPDEPECNAPELTLPVFDYANDGGEGSCSVTGGYVYRGAIASIRGHYFFGDFCSARIWSLVWDGEDGVEGEVVDRTAELEPAQGSIDFISSFGEDGSGELYIVDFGRRSEPGSGEVFRVVPEPEPAALSGAALATLICVGAARAVAARRRCRRGKRAS